MFPDKRRPATGEQYSGNAAPALPVVTKILSTKGDTAREARVALNDGPEIEAAATVIGFIHISICAAVDEIYYHRS